MNKQPISLLFALFAVSGLTGLIYESVWSHYLKLFLGSAAFAQSFVLAVFMGGLAMGAWIMSRRSDRLKNLLLLYGVTEALIGAAALVFHEVFVALTDASLNHVIPALGSPDWVEAFKYLLCAVLILPQTILLGMTFPLMSGSVIRRDPHNSGHHLAMLYFTNSIGAAAGALLAAFLLIGWLGMPGTMRLAGALNVLLAVAVFALARTPEPKSGREAPQQVANPSDTGRPIVKLFLAAAFVTGAASFVYEIAWIRMLSLVLGASFHAFELMLSAFITGLALGGLWIRRRIDKIANPMHYAGLIQVAMGLAALGTVFLYHYSFDWMAWALGVLQKNDAAYPVFSVFSHAIAFLVMLPATFLAGMTLPLFTHALMRSGHGERSIGQIYSANTLGAISGVLLAVHLLVPETGVKLTLILGAAADIVLGGWLLRYATGRYQRTLAFSAIALGMTFAAITARAEILSPERLASGVYRYGRAVPEKAQILYYRDGKTASVAVRTDGGSVVSIVTNGKPDAAINLHPASPPTGDEYTMTLLGALPLLLKPDAKRYANIGFGSGLTAEVLLSHSSPQSLDTVEIEPAMVSGAFAFAPRVIRPFKDKRASVAFEDAKSFFARHHKVYDVIISEPSNPWVNGVAGLFTTEFYRDIRRHLAPGGLLVQWLHLYEFNDRLLGSILSALSENFSDFEIYEANNVDLVVVAVVEGRAPRALTLPEQETPFMEHLKRIGITHGSHISARRMLNKQQAQRLFAHAHPPVNSDYHPYVQLESTRARFVSRIAHAVQDLSGAALPVIEMTGGGAPEYLTEVAPAAVPAVRLRDQSAALETARLLLDPGGDPLSADIHVIRSALTVLKRPAALCGAVPESAALDQLHVVAELTLAHLGPELRRRIWTERRWQNCAPDRLSDEIRNRLKLYEAIATRDARAMLTISRASLNAERKADVGRWDRFLLATALLGANALGEHAATDAIWRRHGMQVFPGREAPGHIQYLLNPPH